ALPKEAPSANDASEVEKKLNEIQHIYVGWLNSRRGSDLQRWTLQIQRSLRSLSAYAKRELNVTLPEQSLTWEVADVIERHYCLLVISKNRKAEDVRKITQRLRKIDFHEIRYAHATVLRIPSACRTLIDIHSFNLKDEICDDITFHCPINNSEEMMHHFLHVSQHIFCRYGVPLYESRVNIFEEITKLYSEAHEIKEQFIELQIMHPASSTGQWIKSIVDISNEPIFKDSHTANLAKSKAEDLERKLSLIRKTRGGLSDSTTRVTNLSRISQACAELVACGDLQSCIKWIRLFVADIPKWDLQSIQKTAKILVEDENTLQFLDQWARKKSPSEIPIERVPIPEDLKGLPDTRLIPALLLELPQRVLTQNAARMSISMLSGGY
ncbi:MAG: hypothetical protein WAW41_03850, partial [Methylobacter sp.]